MNSVKLSVLIIVTTGIFHLGTGQTIQHLVFGGSNYTIHAQSMQWHNWEKSRLACKKTGGDLVSIESLDEWDFLKNIIQTMKTEEYFIGLRKYSKFGEWRWISDNSTVNTTKGIFPWAKDEPNGDGNCAIMYQDYRQDYGEYNDNSCTDVKTIGYICESPAQSNGKDDGRERCSCYTFDNGTHPQGFTWPQARVSCEYEKKHLLVIETEREWEFITEAIQTRKGAISDEWLIGLYKNSAGNWTWIDGKPLTIDKWPKNKPGDTDYYALIAKEWPVGSKGLFNSIRGDISRGWICEEETDNCQLGCFSLNYSVPTNATPAESTTASTQTQRETSTAHGHTNVSDSTTTSTVPGVSEQKGDNGNSSTIVITAASCAAVLFAALIVLAVVLVLRRKKRRGHAEDARNCAGKRNQLDAQDGSWLSPANGARQLGLLHETEVDNNERRNQRRESQQSTGREYEYTMLSPATMMVTGDKLYTSLLKSEQEARDSTDESSVVALPLLQPIDEPSDESPTYVNQMTLSEYMNI